MTLFEVKDARPSRLTILAPGLLGPMRGDVFTASDLPATAGLVELLDHSTQGPGPNDYESAVRDCFGLPADAPAAQGAVGFLADVGHTPETGCLCATPIHLRIETDYLLLYDDELLRIENAEVSALVAHFNRTYNDDGLHLEAATPTRWYLTGFSTDGVSTTPLRVVRGRAIGPFMPAGENGGHLRALLNEIQMLFHDHPVNQARAERGQPAVSGLWLWGEGAAPKAVATSWVSVWAEDPWVCGLARLGDVPAAAPPEALPTSLPDGPALVVVDGADTATAYADATGWAGALAGAERQWFAPAWQALRAGRFKAVEIMPGDGRRFVARRRRWPRLRRPRSLTSYLQGA